MWWIPEEHCQNKTLTELFQWDFSFFFFLNNSGLQKVQLFRHRSVFKIHACCLLLQSCCKSLWWRVTLVWWIVFLLQLYGCFSDERKEMFFQSVQMLQVYVLAQEVRLFWCLEHKGVTYTWHCRRMLDENLRGPYSALCASRSFTCSICLP